MTSSFRETDASTVVPLAEACAASDLTLATAESATGGRVAACIAEREELSPHLLGSVVAYAVEVKQNLLQVPAELVQDETVVSEDTARAMAAGVRALLDADVGIATTGVAGPDPRYGKPPGTMCIAVCSPDGSTARTYRFDGDRPEVIEQAARAALQLAQRVVCGTDAAAESA